MTGLSAVPTLRGLDHIGLTVQDREAAARFFETHFGCERVFEAGPFEDPRGTFMSAKLGVDSRASVSLTFLRCGSTANIELLEYFAPDQDRSPPRISDVGAAHLGMYVDDLDAARAYFEAVDGVTVFEGPNVIPSGEPNAGSGFLFIRLPFGVMVELVNYPPSMPYERTTDVRLFEPSSS